MAGSREVKEAEITRTQALSMKACGRPTGEILTITGIKSSTFYELQKRAANAGYQPGGKILLEHVQPGTPGPGTMPLTPVKKVVKKTPTQTKGKGKAVKKAVKPQSDSDEDDSLDEKEEQVVKLESDSDEDDSPDEKEEKVVSKAEPMEDDSEEDAI
ncbi:hypothetical protein DL546_003441 [Coniochaeta pulveracea]|uniref:Uncharacterized protein n=1 Tax=Coniochaeta pulveracea TaxID=177199 RepID=A0A420XYX0_9PEZI|nr:hypothetical protein DL546_003441 [Coniochaeta pulveracea]